MAYDVVLSVRWCKAGGADSTFGGADEDNITSSTAVEIFPSAFFVTGVSGSEIQVLK